MNKVTITINKQSFYRDHETSEEAFDFEFELLEKSLRLQSLVKSKTITLNKSPDKILKMIMDQSSSQTKEQSTLLFE